MPYCMPRSRAGPILYFEYTLKIVQKKLCTYRVRQEKLGTDLASNVRYIFATLCPRSLRPFYMSIRYIK